MMVDAAGLVRTSFSGATLAAPILGYLCNTGDVCARGFQITHRGRQMASDVFGSLFERVVVKVRVSLRRGRLGVTKQFADDRQSEARSGAYGRVGVAQIVDPDAVEPRSFRDGFPWLF
jgi:hypothetical protein